jgi:hypothetical protein
MHFRVARQTRAAAAGRNWAARTIPLILIVAPVISLAVDNPCKFKEATHLLCTDPRCECGKWPDRDGCVGNKAWRAYTGGGRRDICSGTATLYLQRLNARGCAMLKNDTRNCLWNAGTEKCNCPEYDPNSLQLVLGEQHYEVICEQCPT